MWEGAYPKNEVENSQAPSRGFNLQEKGEVFDTVFDIDTCCVFLHNVGVCRVRTRLLVDDVVILCIPIILV